LALILKTGKTTRDPYNGRNLSTAYARIVATETPVFQNNHIIRVAVYPNKSARDDNKPSFEAHTLNTEFVVIDITDFNTFFEDSVLKQANKSVLSQSYVYLIQAVDEDDNLIWEDWESDE